MADFEISTNFKLLKEGVIDERQYRANYNGVGGLLGFTVDDFIPNDFLVVCGGLDDATKKGVYLCLDNTDLANPVNWKNVSSNTNLLKSNGLIVSGDSISSATGASIFTKGYAYLLQKAIGGNFFNFSRPGNQIADNSMKFLIPNVNPFGDGKDPIVIHALGTNDAINYGVNVDKQSIFKRILVANLAWCAIPLSKKVLGQSMTLSNFSYIDLLQKGMGIQAAATGATATSVINTLANNAIYIGYLLDDNSTGTFTISVDGTLVQDPLTGLTTFKAFGDNSALVSTSQNPATTQAMAAVRVPVTAAGNHTVVITKTGGNNVTLLWAGSAPTNSNDNPVVVAAGILHQNSSNDTISGLYDGFVAAAVTTLAADNLNIYFGDIRAALGTNFSANFADSIHPNDAGHALEFSEILTAIPTRIKVGNVAIAENQPTQDFVEKCPVNPSRFSSPNAHNLNDPNKFTPGITWIDISGNMSWTNFQANTGVTTMFPNTGGTEAWCVGAYEPSGTSPVKPPTRGQMYLMLNSNGVFKWFTDDAGNSNTMTAQGGLVRFGPHNGFYSGNALMSFFDTYIAANQPATNSANYPSAPLKFRANIFNGTSNGTFPDDILLKNQPQSNTTNPDVMLTASHDYGGTGSKWGVDFSGATRDNLLGSAKFEQIKLTRGTNKVADNAVLIAGTVTISNNLVTATSFIQVFYRNGYTPTIASILVVTNLNVGVGFTVKAFTPGTNTVAVADANDIAYFIVN